MAADTFRAKQLHDEYTESPEYMALLRGALGMMKVAAHVRFEQEGNCSSLRRSRRASVDAP